MTMAELMAFRPVYITCESITGTALLVAFVARGETVEVWDINAQPFVVAGYHWSDWPDDGALALRIDDQGYTLNGETVGVIASWLEYEMRG